MRLAGALASMKYPEDLVVDIATSRKAGTIELLIAALKELDGETCTLTTIGAITEARRRKTTTPCKSRFDCSPRCAATSILRLDLIQDEKGAPDVNSAEAGGPGREAQRRRVQATAQSTRRPGSALAVSGLRWATPARPPSGWRRRVTTTGAAESASNGLGDPSATHTSRALFLSPALLLSLG